MDLLYPILGIGALVFLGSLAWESFGRRRALSAASDGPPAGMTFVTKPLLTDHEVQLYNLLRLAVEDRYLLFTQIPLWSLLDLRRLFRNASCGDLAGACIPAGHVCIGASWEPFGREGGAS